MASTSKQTRGKQKIEIKRIEDNDDRLITFSKRRSGIYKKASELVSMCGAEVGVIVFSPTGKPFSFGHPSVQTVTDKFLGRNIPPPAQNRLQQLFDASEKIRMDIYNYFFNRLLARLDAEKERGRALSRITRATSEGTSSNRQLGWWEKPLEELSLSELHETDSFMETFYRHLCNFLNHPVDLGFLGLANPMVDPTTANDPSSGEEAGAGPC
ncbi:agamous-like MADS-box protein AGL61 [Punica granatum]|uniref:MADS-box domain-containing protein n=2 Tax=Punica granatum TaxID=22663 RepID=A0A218XX73_PUNGR|nr:agamous-like MADS-box protein AGL61 [Punica granatum]OWM89378.1 hypothetical protein CDL15_Pgr024126 [Punica granatum]PKI61916.1 hypothetical protein CRG98_017642 [Punica granatum]